MGRTKNEGGLGFRDLMIFNKVLLAKQIWRVLKNPDSLVARILKAKYYPHGTIMDANTGRHPSNVWLSIISAKSIIEKGKIWRIGNGEDVQVWGDRWIPVPLMFSI
jgi:hypothetical protein